jgi:hypothetical protein
MVNILGGSLALRAGELPWQAVPYLGSSRFAGPTIRHRGICASVEYHGGTQAQALESIEEKIRRNSEEVLASAKNANSLPRQAAVPLAEARVRKAMMYQK